MSVEFGFGISTKGNSVEAGRSVAQGASKKIRRETPCLALLFVSCDRDLDQVVRGVREVLGQVPVYGITTAGEIYNRNYDGSVLLFLIASSHVVADPFLVTGLTRDYDRSLTAIMDELRKTLIPGRGVPTPVMTLGFSGIPAGSVRYPLKGIVEACVSEGMLPPALVAMELGRFSPRGSGRVIVGDAVHEDAFLGLILHLEVGYDMLCGSGGRPSGRVLMVTGSRDGTVTSLNGIAPWDAYRKAVGSPDLPVERWGGTMAESPLAVAGPWGNHVVMPREIDRAGAFVFGSEVREGTALQVLTPPPDPGFIVSLLERSDGRGTVKDPAFSLVFKAPSPNWSPGVEKEQDQEIRAVAQRFPHLPVFGCYVESILAPDLAGGLSVNEHGSSVWLLDKLLDPTVAALQRMEGLLVDYQVTNKELQSRIAELSNLYRITQNMTETIDLQKILRLILEGITNELGYDRVSLCLVSGRRLTGKMTIGHEHLQESFATSLSDKSHFLVSCLEKKSPLVLEAPFGDSVPGSFQEGLQAPAIACIPLMARGKPLGVIVVDNRFSESPITMEGIQSLSTLANTAASAIDNSLMHAKVRELNTKLQKKVDVSREELSRTNMELESSQTDLRKAYDDLKEVNRELDERIAKLSTPGEMSRTFVSVHNFDKLLHMFLQSAMTELSADRGSILLIQPETGELAIKVGIGLSPEAMYKLRFKVGEGIAGSVVRDRRPALVRDASSDPRFVAVSGRSHPNSLIAVPLVVKDEVLGAVCVENKSTSRTFGDKDLEFLEILASQGSITIANAQLFEKLQKNYFETVMALSTAVEAKDPYTLGHSKRVTEYCIALADEFDLSPDEVQCLKFGAILHDVGKIGVAGSILNKPDRLTASEFDSIKAHAVIGENIVKDVDFLQPIRPLIRNHQERYDGSGYPDGLAGEEIPFMATVIAVADVFDALVTDRPYRRAFSHDEAVRYIEGESGVQFNPKVVEAFLKIFR
jgi:HD-GYP domain-containing protein (c-di-GMP phosphodiesterase class II)/uncharacterized protein YigA (DUF484 family)